MKAAKRVFLSSSMREKLKNYSVSVDTFLATIEQESTDSLIKYREYISSILKHFPNVPPAMLITLCMKEVATTKFKISIMNKSDLSLINNLTCVDFVWNDDPENYQCTSITLNEEIRNIWSAINYGVMEISDIEEPEVELACILLDYIAENIPDDREELRGIIDKTQGASMLRDIVDELNEMQNELVRTIDKITN